MQIDIINDSVFLPLKVNKKIDWTKAKKIEVTQVEDKCLPWVSVVKCTNPDCPGFFSHSQVGLR